MSSILPFFSVPPPNLNPVTSEQTIWKILKSKLSLRTLSCTDQSDDLESNEKDACSENDDSESISIKRTCHNFKRKFNNVDMASYWLNSCLQLILTAMDHSIIHL